MNNLTKSITIHSAYGVEVEYENGTVCRVDVNQPLYNYTEKTISVHVAIQDIENKEAKLLLHSLDKLTKEIDGKVGMEEIAKLAFDGRYEVKKPYLAVDGVHCQIITKNHRITTIGFSFETKSFFKTVDGVYKGFAPNQLELFNYLLEKGYNVFGLSSEYVKEKAISKNNGSRDIGLVDMMDIDTY